MAQLLLLAGHRISPPPGVGATLKERNMLVRYRMTKEPVTVEPDEWLSHAAHKMQAGGFRRLPVVSNGKLVGIVTDRDARQHHGRLEQTKIKEAMTESPLIIVTPATTLEEAAGIMLEQQIGGLPVLDEGRLVGIITASDVMHAFLDVMGASKGGSTRIDFVLEGEGTVLSRLRASSPAMAGRFWASAPTAISSGKIPSVICASSTVTPTRSLKRSAPAASMCWACTASVVKPLNQEVFDVIGKFLS